MPVSTKPESAGIAVPVISEKVTAAGGHKFFRKKIEINESKVSNADPSLNTKEDFCQNLLSLGFVQSYVDFFNLTHRIDPFASEGSTENIKMSKEDMSYLQSNLVVAEIARRQGNTAGIFTAYKKLAIYYAKGLDWKTAIYFYEKCLDIAQLTSDSRAEMAANHEIGTVYQEMNEPAIAQKYHEKHDELATASDVLEEVAKANSELCKVYLALAQQHENLNYFDEALELYKQCLNSSKKCWDKNAEGEANGKIGALLLNLGDHENCISFLTQQSMISADLGFAEGRCRACSALALAYDKLNRPDKALLELNLVHTISEQAGDMMLQAHACKSLGTLYSKLGKLDEAVESLQKHFNLVKTILQKGPPKTSAQVYDLPKLTSNDLDMARVYLGISKGNLLLGSYIVKIQDNMSSLLNWKLSRADL